MSRLLTITVEQETETGPNRNGDVYVPGRLVVKDVREAGLLTRWYHAARDRIKPIPPARIECLPDTMLTVGVRISTEQYAKLMNMRCELTFVHGQAMLSFVPTPKPNQLAGSPDELCLTK